MQKINKILCSIIIGVTLIFGGCSSMGTTAVSQITSQTNDPVMIARAAYYDANAKFVMILESYIDRYKPYLDKRDPEMAASIENYFMVASDVLDKWDKLSKMGTTPDNAADLTKYLDNIIQLMLQVDTMKENGEM